MHQYIEFIQKYSIGLEGSSCWCWFKNDKGKWQNVGFAEDTIEESLNLLEQYIYEEGIQPNARAT